MNALFRHLMRRFPGAVSRPYCLNAAPRRPRPGHVTALMPRASLQCEQLEARVLPSVTVLDQH